MGTNSTEQDVRIDQLLSSSAKPHIPGDSKPPTVRPPRHTSSKYDFVKVRVWLGENADHYYVLSRFLVSRMLTVTRIPAVVAIKIALELKKLLVDLSLLDVSQADLETNLFLLMNQRGFGEDYVSRYKMMTRFHHQRTPLIILICGTTCVGKSSIATQLAQRLNLPNVLQTDMVYELLRSGPETLVNQVPVWARPWGNAEDLVSEFARECRIVRKGLEGDLGKAVRDGKPLIIEGMHVDLGSFLNSAQATGGLPSPKHQASAQSPISPAETSHEPPSDVSSSIPHLTPTSGVGRGIWLELGRKLVACRIASSKFVSAGVLHRERASAAARLEEEKEESSRVEGLGGQAEEGRDGSSVGQSVQDQDVSVQSDSVEQHSLNTHASDSEEHLVKEVLQSPSPSNPSSDTDLGPTKQTGEAESVPEPPEFDSDSRSPIIVPIVLRMEAEEHKALLAEWTACRVPNMSEDDQLRGEEVAERLQQIQDHLCSYEDQGVLVLTVTPTSFPKALDCLHAHLLQCIERGLVPLEE